MNTRQEKPEKYKKETREEYGLVLPNFPPFNVFTGAGRYCELRILLP
jgi:hypothetical protein